MENFEIISKRRLAQKVVEYKIYAPLAARHARAGQFVILRTDEDGERVPFTVCDYCREDGTVSLLVQEVGYTTMRLAGMSEGERLADLVGPLGNPTDLAEYNNILLIAGGIGVAVVYPQLKQLAADGKRATVISGARTKDLLIYTDEMRALADELHEVTDDGSSGERGLVTDIARQLIDADNAYDAVFAVGPIPMMKAVAELTRGYGIKTIISMNSMMVDGTGMCGCCRLTVGGSIKYACIDGPEFDGHLVDFDEAIARSRVYRVQEQAHVCNLRGGL